MSAVHYSEGVNLTERIRALEAERDALRASFEEALDRMRTAFLKLSPDETPEDRETIAQALYFGIEHAEQALSQPFDVARYEKEVVARWLTEERLATALHDSDLMRRYQEYAERLATMDPTPYHDLCFSWAAALRRALLQEPESPVTPRHV